MPIPDGITREHVLKAIDEINREGVPPKHQAQNTFLVVEGKKYPVKYVVLKAAKVAGVDLSIKEFTTLEAKNYLKRLGFNIVREEWKLGIRILSKAGEGFIKRASEEGFNVSMNQLGYFSKKGHTIYYKLKLPPELNISSKLVHFEWLARPEEESAQFMVGLHLEFPREQRKLNRKLADLLLEYVDLDKLGKRVGAPVVREDKIVFTWFTASKMYESPADTEEEIIEWLVTSMLEFYKTFLPALKDALDKIKKHEPSYWVEIASPPTMDYVGKLIWAPKGKRWKIIEEVKEGDVVYHYITSKGPSEYQKKFVGKSKVKGFPKVVKKEEIKERLQSIVSSWDEHYSEFTDTWFSRYNEFYLLELEDFEPFEPPISASEIGFKAPQSYFIRAPSEIIKALDVGKFSESEVIIPPKMPSKIDNLLARKGQLILYGPPGTGKTWLASKYIRHKVPNGIHSLGKDSSLREDIKYYLLVMSTAKYDPSQIKEGLEEVFSGKLLHAFEEIEEGDIAFVYLTHPYKRVTAIARCTGKTEEGAKFKIIKLVNGPTYDEMKREEPISDSLAVRTMLRGTLFPLSHEEAQWIASKIGFDALKPLGVLDEGTKREFKAFEFVTFHPAFSYEDFVEGIKPETYEDPETGKKELLFKVEEGVFKRISRNAYNALLAWAGVEKEWTENTGLPSLSKDEIERIKRKIKNEAEGMPKFYLIIDEINRGDIPKIFGELITLLETDKRLFMDNETVTTLPYSKKRFGVPPNLHIIGTMNTSDRSIALMDVALRRRFGFIEMMPDYTVLKEHIIDNASEEVKPLAGIAVSALKALNKRIKREYDRDHQIGHSYYFRLNDHLNSREEFLKELKIIWFHEILPLLQEYFYDSPEKLERVLKSKNSENSFIRSSEDGIELKSEDEFTDDSFLEALKALIEAERE
ncbi:AAA family ATPase [Thermococcus gorgonarius]|uniref:AAA+ ATPase domain-containing protein n=1 Tax=Thermococcus gorgonarius TaxID=71997 RepID=A0A2Z2M7M3_THEGO|nr:AAA family ATPase [Thermococcus gorgonarius]ASJ00332.1 hypothetical protein A3K92_01970 [Thermococcus gorgonarius]